MRLVAIDPGPIESACVWFNDGDVYAHDIWPNDELLGTLAVSQWVGESDAVVIEQIKSYGKSVGEDVFETVWWTGRFFDRAAGRFIRTEMVPRRNVKMYLCNSMSAKDSDIRQRLIDIYGGTGGREKAIGRKASPGPLYGIKRDEWQALALAVTFNDTEVS